MAVEVVVSVVVQKLVDLLVHEVNLLHGLDDEVVWIEREMRSMLCFLKDADEKQGGNARIKNWVADIRDVAYDAEDVIETLTFLQAQQKRRGLVKRYAFTFNNLITNHKVGKKIEQIKKKIAAISISRITYGIEDIGGVREEGSSSASERLRNRRRTPHSDGIVGVEKVANELEARLIREEPRLSVISIVGMGGLGKTTLAKKVFNSDAIKKHFDCCAWISVSQTYTIKELLQDIAKKVMGLERKDSKYMTREDLEEKISGFLQERRYIVVMDDIWRTDAWDDIKSPFPNNAKGSRVVLTTRNKVVAEYADPVSPFHELQPLSDDDSWALFSKKVFPVEENNIVGKFVPPMQLEEIGKKIVKKCGGLPLAIVLLGGFLSRKPESVSEWSKVLDRLNWQLNQDQTPCSEILALSYYDLPIYLKPCFLYLGLLPEDSEISARRLIRLWISEGFVQQRGDQIAEVTGEEYLEELIDRCMVQVASRRPFGSVKKCRFHDLLRDISISKAKEDKLFQIHPDANSSTSTPTPTKVRRLAVHSAAESFSMEHSLQNVRSFSCSDGLDHRHLDGIFHNRGIFGMLRVLDLGRPNFQSNYGYLELPKAIGKLIHLRYLRLIDYRVKRFSSSIGKLQNLQTLDLKRTRIEDDGSVIWEMHQLRYLFLADIEGTLKLDPPRSRGDGSSDSLTRNLQTLWGLRIDKKSQVKDGWDKFTNLIKLCVVGDLESHVDALGGWIAKLDRLESLKLRSQKNVFENPIERLLIFSNHINLYKLELLGVRINKLPHPHEFPPYMTRLQFCYTELVEDPFPTLGKLPNLKYLGIAANSSIEAREIVCLAGAFPQLQHLSFEYFNGFEEWSVEEGALPNLRKLCIQGCSNLKMVPDGLLHVTTLQELRIIHMPNEFTVRVQKNVGEDWYKVAHVLSLEILYFNEGKREIARAEGVGVEPTIQCKPALVDFHVF